MIIRYARNEDMLDIERLCAAGDAAFRGKADIYGAIDTLAQTQERMGRGQTLVAEHDGHVVGMVSRAPDPRARVTHLVNLYVEPAARHLGLGRSLVESAEQESHMGGSRVSVAISSDGAQEFYEHLGYRAVAMVMEKALR